MRFLLLFLVSGYAYAAKLDPKNVATWLGADAQDISCFLEKQHNYKDGDFPCTRKGAFGNPGDEAYTKGPFFGGDAKKVNPKFQNIQLEWENGKLREINVYVKTDWKKAKALFKVPSGIAFASRHCGKNETCATLQLSDRWQAPFDGERPAYWARARANTFGCYLEKKTGHKDKTFNCDRKNYVNVGGPCQNTDEYYEGPQLPAQLAAKLHPDFSAVELTWEHGDLQAFRIKLPKGMTEEAVKKKFHLPKTPTEANAMQIEVSQCAEATCLDVTAFDHQGAGDVDCGE